MNANTTHGPQIAINTAVRYGLLRAVNSFDKDDADAPARVVVAMVAEHHALVVSIDEAEMALTDVAVPLDIATNGDFTVFDLMVYAVDEILFNKGILADAPLSTAL